MAIAWVPRIKLTHYRISRAVAEKFAKISRIRGQINNYGIYFQAFASGVVLANARLYS
jgi:hypothetical protein